MSDEPNDAPAEPRLNTDVAIVGGGMAGLAIARELQGRGRQVLLLDKGWHPGGRFASRRLAGGAAFVDHGVQRFILPSAHRWWSGTSIRRVRGVEDGSEAMLATPARTFVSALADGLTIRLRHRVDGLRALPDGQWLLRSEDGIPSCQAQTVVLACPGPQAADLLASAGLEQPDAAVLRYRPRWVITGSVPRSARIRIGDLMPAMDGIDRGPDIPGHGRQCLRLQASEAWSQQRVDWPEAQVVEAVEQALIEAGAEDLQELHAKRWRYAQAASHGESVELRRAPGLYIAGDWTQPGDADRGVDRALTAAAQVISQLIEGAA